MRRIAVMIALGVTLGAMTAQAAPSDKREPQAPSDALRIVRDNAGEAQYNAKIYQWQRVNREVDRIAAQMPRVRKMVSGEKLNALEEAVTQLRKARAARNAERAAEMAQRVAEISESLLTK